MYFLTYFKSGKITNRLTEHKLGYVEQKFPIWILLNSQAEENFPLRYTFSYPFLDTFLLYYFVRAKAIKLATGNRSHEKIVETSDALFRRLNFERKARQKAVYHVTGRVFTCRHDDQRVSRDASRETGDVRRLRCNAFIYP